jgi:hypothetical protein
MHKLILMIIAISFLTSCTVINRDDIKKLKSNQVSEQINKTKTEPRKPVLGETVVAAWNTTLWAEGKVVSLGADNAKIEWLDKSSPNEVELSRVFVMPDANAAMTAKPGDYVLVKEDSGNWWQESQIQEVAAGVIKIKPVDSETAINVSPEKIIAVSPPVAADIKDHAATQDFLRQAHARRPVAPPDYQPKVGDRILGEWTTNVWYGGKVKALSADRALIVWENGVKPDEATFDKIVPFPTADEMRQPAVDDFVLLKPKSGGWLFGQVTSVQGTAIEAKDISSSRLYKPGEFVVLAL